MKKRYIVLLLILMATNVSAADTLVTKLINTIYLQQVDSLATYYYLLDAAKNPTLTMSDVEDLKRFEHFNTDSLPFGDFIANIKKDSANMRWSVYSFQKAKIVDKEHLPKYRYNYRIFKYIDYDISDSLRSKPNVDTIMIVVKKGMTKKEIEIARLNAVKKFESKPVEEKNWYWFSKPVFSNDETYVLISLNEAEHGCTYIFKKVNNCWIKVLQFKCWVS